MLERRRSLFRSLAVGAATALLLAVLTALSTALMMRCAPGFFSDERELDSRYGVSVQQDLRAEQRAQGSVFRTCAALGMRWIHLDFGRSRTWDVPVWEILRSRIPASATLLGISLPLSWMLAVAIALPYSARGAAGYDFLATASTSLMLAIPAGALATMCIVAGHGGPTLVLTALLVGRLYRFLHGMLRQSWSAHHVAVARGYGISNRRLLIRYVLPQIWPQLVPLFGMSVMTALAALVPVEVVFDQPGLGKLAWQSSMNRDLPVLAAVTLFFAGAVSLAGAISNGSGAKEGQRV